MSANNEQSRKIAIIGMSCRLPGATNVNEFWENLVNGVESITTFTDEELREGGIEESLINSPNYVKSRGIIDGAKYFDAAFFGVTPRDAEIMDPQHRIFLECAWHALEDAGYDPEKTSDRIGVFGGTGANFHMVSTYTNPEVKKYASGTSIVTGNDKDYLATRVSYKLNLTGPSLTVQSACSTSMAAVVMGVNSLLSYQSDMILAGGSTIELPEKRGYMYQEGGLESSDGHCRTFDKAADGTVFSRGAGVVLLKRYEDAERDGDHIYASILAGAINNDGNRKVGFTAPSVEGQVNLAIEALELSGIDPSTITYVEAHGTATNVGDPIEVTALSQAFSSYSNKKQFCAIGSVKTNIGHTDSASGVAGLIKTAMALQHKKIPAHLHFNEANPKIDFPNSPFYVNTKLREWEAGDSPRRAIVNSFGVGGTNACVILEEAAVPAPKNDTADYKTLFLSARTDTALDTAKANLHAHLTANPELSMDDLAYSYQVGRRSFQHKGVAAYKTREELLAKLTANDGFQTKASESADLPVIFMFPGQGNQYLNMGVGLYNENVLFRNKVDQCCDFLLKKHSLDLKAFLFATQGSAEAKAALEQTYVTQPAIFVISYAMACVVLEMGVKPAAMIGHSVGEYVAACLSGIMSLQDALSLIARRGALVQDLPGGSMIAVLQNEDKITPLLIPGVEVAVVNNPGLCVLAGSYDDIATMETKLAASGYFTKKLATSHAFHSAMMEPMLDEFATEFATVNLSAPGTPIISTVTGHYLTAIEATDPQYWVSHVRKPVRFTDAVLTAIGGPDSVFLEIGPGQSLESAVKRHLDKESKHSAIRTMRAELETADDNEFLATTVGQIWMSGGQISWPQFYQHNERKRIPLPGYPYEREAYAIGFSKNKQIVTEKKIEREPDKEKWFNIPTWKRSAHIDYLVSTPTDQKTWLVVHDEGGLGIEVVKQLKKTGQNVQQAFARDYYSKEGNDCYGINIANKEDYEWLMKDIAAEGHAVTHVINLLNYGCDISTTPDNPYFEQVENRAFFSPLYLLQAFYAVNKLKDMHISVVSNGVFDVVGEKVYAPENALSIGTCRVLIQEYPTIRAKFIDADIPRSDAGLIALAKNLVRETYNDSFETVVCYRNGYRWTEDHKRVPLERSANKTYRDGGVYLITGGLGGLGILSAKAIASEVKATFILTYHSGLPERADWDTWLTENPGKSFTRDKIEGVRDLEAVGSKVILYQVNVADLEGMRQLVANTEKFAGKINGIIHSAGIVGGGIIPLKTEASARPVFESKFRGTVVLDQVFAGHDLDFFWLYSSITAIAGEATRLDYCSANAFLDSFATYRKWTVKDNTTSINWPGWIDVGMAGRWEDTKSTRVQKNVLRPSKDLLSLIKQDGDTQIFEVSFRPDADWVINSHFIAGQPTVVGTSFIELANQCSKVLFPCQQAELRNLYFITPLMFERGKDKRVRLLVEQKGSKYKFNYQSQLFDKDAESDTWHDHFMGDIQLATVDQLTLNLDEIKLRLSANFEERVIDRVVLDAKKSPLIELGDRWDVRNKIYIGQNDWLAEMKLKPEFYADTEYFDFHPALVDIANSFALRYVSNSPFLPFSYKSVKVYSKLPAEIYSYVTLSEGSGGSEGTMSFDVTFTDLSGNVCVEMLAYTLKKVNDLPAAPKAAEADSAKKQSKQNNDEYINSEEGFVIIKHLLETACPEQMIVYPCDFNFMVEDNIPNEKKLAEKKEIQKSAAKSYYLRPALNTAYAEPANEMEKTIAQIWQDILGLDKIGRNDTFTELGGNSLLAIQTIANIVDVLEVELSAQVFYDNPTVQGLAEAVVSSIMDLEGIDNLKELMESMDLDAE